MTTQTQQQAVAISAARRADLANCLPVSGHSMGCLSEAYLDDQPIARSNTRERYARSCPWRPTHGYLRADLSEAEVAHGHNLHGVWTVLVGREELPRRGTIARARWLIAAAPEGRERTSTRAAWADGYVVGIADHRDPTHTRWYHSECAADCKSWYSRARADYDADRRCYLNHLHRNNPAAPTLRQCRGVVVAMSDSVAAGNCRAGSEAFRLRHGLPSSGVDAARLRAIALALDPSDTRRAMAIHAIRVAISRTLDSLDAKIHVPSC